MELISSLPCSHLPYIPYLADHVWSSCPFRRQRLYRILRPLSLDFSYFGFIFFFLNLETFLREMVPSLLSRKKQAMTGHFCIHYAKKHSDMIEMERGRQFHKVLPPDSVTWKMTSLWQCRSIGLYLVVTHGRTDRWSIYISHTILRSSVCVPHTRGYSNATPYFPDDGAMTLGLHRPQATRGRERQC